MRILNRLVEWTDDGIQYEADQRHAELVIKELGLKEYSKPVATPGVKSVRKYEEGVGEEMRPEGATRFRAIAARAMYLSQDRSDVQFASKELARRMAQPVLQRPRKMNSLSRCTKDRREQQSIQTNAT